MINHLKSYPSPHNFTYAYSVGAVLGLFFAIQLVTGIFLAMHYTGGIINAFDSVVYIMTEVKFGSAFRYMHANGASMIFILIYLHIGRGLYYRSYLFSRSILWLSGIIILLLMMATAFIGYVLPWGQMSFWGATVITSLVTAIPFIGDNIATWVWGGFSVSNATLVRFFGIHYFLPFVITGFIGSHLALLHQTKSTNPIQIETILNKVPFTPYYTVKDAFAFTSALIFFFLLINFLPNFLGHPDNFIPANALVTPAHIVPEWYFTPFYAILRSCPSKLGGVISMACSLLIFIALPYFKRKQVSFVARFDRWHKRGFWVFVVIFYVLLLLGGQPAIEPYVFASKAFTVAYFACLILAVPAMNLLWFFIREVLDIFDYDRADPTGLDDHVDELNYTYVSPFKLNLTYTSPFSTRYYYTLKQISDIFKQSLTTIVNILELLLLFIGFLLVEFPLEVWRLLVILYRESLYLIYLSIISKRYYYTQEEMAVLYKQSIITFLNILELLLLFTGFLSVQFPREVWRLYWIMFYDFWFDDTIIKVRTTILITTLYAYVLERLEWDFQYCACFVFLPLGMFFPVLVGYYVAATEPIKKGGTQGPVFLTYFCIISLTILYALLYHKLGYRLRMIDDLPICAMP